MEDKVRLRRHSLRHTGHLLGGGGVPNLKELMADSGRALFILLLLGGFQPIGFHHRQQLSKVFWNGILVLIPLYVTAPVIALCVYVLV